MSSTVSCSSAAHSVSVSRRMPAQIFATPTGWTMKSSPDLRRWSAWCSQAKRKASSTRSRSISTRRVVGVLLDDREQVAEQAALGLGELGAQRPARAPRGARRGRPGTRSAGACAPLRGRRCAAAGGGSVRGSRAMPQRVPQRQRVPPAFGGVTLASVSLPRVVSREEWLVARRELLVQEKELDRARDALNANRRRCRWSRSTSPTSSRALTGRRPARPVRGAAS